MMRSVFLGVERERMLVTTMFSKDLLLKVVKTCDWKRVNDNLALYCPSFFCLGTDIYPEVYIIL